MPLMSFPSFQLWLTQSRYDRQQLVIVATTSLFAYITYKAIDILVVKPYVSVLRDLPGPEKLDSYIWGHLPRIFKTPPGVVHEEWVAQYGPTFQYRGIGLARQFFTLDPKAIAHIMNHSYDYPKPPTLSAALTQLLGKGVLVVEGDDHCRQRRIMNT
ncbi:hypothetical protein FRB93_010818 [Tulasnella sp. JGI-2019a]|nr:hypothetical protein FRB93_010818 [Tulasnella sp. JGI-2019a]